MTNSVHAFRSQREEDEYLQRSDESLPESLPSDASELLFLNITLAQSSLEEQLAVLKKDFEALDQRLDSHVKEVNQKADDSVSEFNQKIEIDESFAFMKQVKLIFAARDLGTAADNKAMDFILPNCRKKPFCLRSYKNLIAFISNPSSDEHTGPHAPKSWSDLSAADQSAIRNRGDFVKRKYDYLVLHIKDLKKGGHTFAHGAVTTGELKKLLIPDHPLYDAAASCEEFLEADLPTIYTEGVFSTYELSS